MTIVIMSKLASSSTMEGHGREWPKLSSLYEELSLSWLLMSMDFDLKLLMSLLVILLDTLLLVNFSKSTLSICNFFLWLYVFFPPFNSVSHPRDVISFILRCLEPTHHDSCITRSLLIFGFSLCSRGMSANAWCLLEKVLANANAPLAWWLFHVQELDCTFLVLLCIH